MAEKKTAAKAKNRASVHDFDVIIEPVITEKTMSLMQEQNKVTVRVSGKARGGRYKGRISGFKKAVVTVKEGQAIDLFKE